MAGALVSSVEPGLFSEEFVVSSAEESVVDSSVTEESAAPTVEESVVGSSVAEESLVSSSETSVDALDESAVATLDVSVAL